MTEKMRFNKIIKSADLVKEINDHYFIGCYQVRNEWMVDRSNLVIAVFNGKRVEMIKECQEKCGKTYGYCRVHIWLERQGIHRNPKTILRVLRN